MSRTRVLRGEVRTFLYDGAVNLIQNDQRFNHGFRIKRFVISPTNLHSSSIGSRDIYGVLGTHPESLEASPGSTVVEWRWRDRRQVAWASTNTIGDSVTEGVFELVDPTHVIVRDLYIGITAGTATGTDEFNYYIELEEIPLSDNEAVMAIIQEESQDVN
jgi:hypothetical protein